MGTDRSDGSPASQNVEARNRYFQQAQDALMAGTDLFERYRPGGAASLASGLYQSQAQLSFNIGTQQQAPDLLGNYRLQREDETKHAAERAAKMQLALGIIQAGAGVAGAALGGIPSMPGPVQQPIPGGPANAGVPPGTPGGPTNAGLPPIGPGQAPGPSPGPGQTPWTPQQVQEFNQGTGRALRSSLGGQPETVPGGPGGGQGGQGAPSGGAGQQQSRGPGGGGRATGMVFGQNGDFSPQALTAQASAGSPFASDLTRKMAMAVINPRSWDVIESGVDRVIERAVMLAVA